MQKNWKSEKQSAYPHSLGLMIFHDSHNRGDLSGGVVCFLPDSNRGMIFCDVSCLSQYEVMESEGQVKGCWSRV